MDKSLVVFVSQKVVPFLSTYIEILVFHPSFIELAMANLVE